MDTVKNRHFFASEIASLQRLYAEAKKRRCESAAEWLDSIRKQMEPTGSLYDVIDLIQTRPLLNERDVTVCEKIGAETNDVALLKICEIVRKKWLTP